jgi:hypothetical protein
LAGHEREALLRVADELGAELGCSGSAEAPGADSTLGGEEGPMAGILGAEDERLVGSLRRALASVAAAAAPHRGPGAPPAALCAALDGAEMVIRGELVRGNGSVLVELMPSFVFMVVLAAVEQDTAIELSQRTSSLVEAALGG